MGEAELGTSKPLGFPPYGRSHSHLRSKTYLTLVRIFSLFPATSDNGSGGMEQEKQGKGPGVSECVGSDFKGPKEPVPEKTVQEIHETNEGVGDKKREFGANDMVPSGTEQMIGVEELEESMLRLLEEMSKEANEFKEHERLTDELELVEKGTEDLVRGSGLISLNSGLNEKQNGSSEVEFQRSDVNKSGNASELQVERELNQLASESFHPSLMVNVSTSTQRQTSELVISTSSRKQERQKNEMDSARTGCAAMDSLPNAKESEFEKKEEQSCSKVPKAPHVSLDHTTSEALNVCEDERLLDSAILGDKHEKKNEEKLQKSICPNNALNSSNILTEQGDIEEGELVGDFGMDGTSFEMPSADSLISHQKKIYEVPKPKSIDEDIVFTSKIDSGEKEGYASSSFTVNKHQDGQNSGQVEPRTSNKNGFACEVEVEISRETVKSDKVGECGSVLKPGNSIKKQIGSKGTAHLPTSFGQSQVMHRGLLEEDSNQDHGNLAASKQNVDVSSKKKRGPGSEEKKAKKKRKKRKNRAEKNRQLGVKRLKLPPVQKSKTISYCRHYLVGRCYEGDKCQFSHDTIPLTKSTPCSFFARHSCMKGDACPFDHQLSKYPCDNFVSRGFCSRGDACLFSHQLSTKEDIPMPSKVCRPELKSPLLSGNRSFSVPPKTRGCSSVPQNLSINTTGIRSHLNSEHKVTDNVQKQLTPALKGVSFVDVAKSSLPSSSTPKQGMITPKKESDVQDGPRADQSASGMDQTMLESPKELPDMARKPINFLSFGEGSVCSFEGSTSSLLNRGNGIELPEIVNFGLPDDTSSSLKKDDGSKDIDGTKQSVPQSEAVSNEIFDQNQSVAERIKLSFPGKALTDDATTDLQGSSCSHADHSNSKPFQEVKEASDNSQTLTVTSSMLLVSSLSLEHLPSRTSNSPQRALLSTLAFAAEHESVIKMKDPAGASPVSSEENINMNYPTGASPVSSEENIKMNYPTGASPVSSE